MLLLFLIFYGLVSSNCETTPSVLNTEENENDDTRKILGSSVVTSVSVVMDAGNGSQAVFSDAAGKPVQKPATASQLASPINLLNPDRYEFYTFDVKGNLVKRLMTLEEIQGIIATGDGEAANYNSQLLENVPKKDVSTVLSHVQNVLKKEIESHQSTSSVKPVYDTPDVSNTWSLILPAIFGNSGDEIQLKKSEGVATPETITYDNGTFAPAREESSAEVKIGNDVSVIKQQTSSAEITTPSEINITKPDKNQSSVETITSYSYIPITSSTKIPEILTDEVITSTNSGFIQETSQVLLIENDLDKELDESKNQLMSQLSQNENSPSTTIYNLPASFFMEENDSVVDESNTKITTIKNSSITENISINKPSTKSSSTESPNPKTTASILLILSTIKKDPTVTSSKNSTEMPFVSITTSNPNQFFSTVSETLVSNKNFVSNTPLNNNPLDDITKTSSVSYEPVQIFTVSSLNNNNKDANSEVLSTTERSPSTSDVFSINNKNDTQSLIKPQENVINNNFNDSNIIQAVDDLLSQIIGFNNSNIDLPTTFPGFILPSAPTKLLDEELSRIEPENALNLTQSFNSNSSSTYLENNINKTSVRNESIDETTKGDILTFNASLLFSQIIDHSTVQPSSNYYQSSTDYLKTTLLPPKENNVEVMKTSENSNKFLKNEVISLKNESNIFPDTTKADIKYTTEKQLTTTDLLTATLNDLFFTTSINQINSLASNNNLPKPQLSDKYLLNNITESVAKEKETKPQLVQEVKPLDNVVPQNFISTTVQPTSNNVNFNYDPKNESKIIDPIASNNSDLYVRITAAPLNKFTTNAKPLYQSKTNNNYTESTPIIVSSSSNSLETSDKVLTKITPTTPMFEKSSSTETGWKLISTIPPPKEVTSTTDKKNSVTTTSAKPTNSVDLIPDSAQAYGLEETTAFLDTDVYRFTELCNELSFSLWSRMYKFLDATRSIFLSPFASISMLAMVFLGAKGATSGEMNEILKLDEMVTFNPHSVFKNVTDTIDISKNSGVSASVILRELYSEKSKGKLLNFYKERVRHFYDGHVEEVNFTSISDVIRRRTNLLVKRHTWGKIHDYLKDNAITARPPLAAVTVSIFQTDCSMTSTSGRDGELHFIFAPTTRQRKLVPIPAAVWHSGFLAGYDPGLDATAVSIGTTENTVSTILVIPGQQGIAAPGDGLSRLEERLTKTAFAQGSWSRLLRSLIPRPGLEVQVPRFAHRSTINTTAALEEMGLKELFNPSKADLKGLNSYAHEMFLSDLLQVNYFVMCGEGKIGERHYFEEYPVSLDHSSRESRNLKLPFDNFAWTDPKEFQRAFDDSLFDTSLLNVPLPLRPRQARVPDTPRLRFDRPFLYFVRHNPTGLILHMGRFNPKLYQ